MVRGRICLSVVLLGLVLAACVGGGGFDLRSALRQTEGESGRLFIKGEALDGADVPGWAQMEMDAEVDTDDRRLRMEMFFPVAKRDRNIEMILDGEDVYLLTSAGAKKPWIITDVATMEKLAKTDMSSLSDMASGEILSSFTGGLPEADEVGSGTVRGVETTRYETTFDFDELVEMAGANRTDLAMFGPGEVSVEGWVDGDGYVRRTIVEGPSASGIGSYRMTLEPYDIGEDIQVDLPPPDQVRELPGF